MYDHQYGSLLECYVNILHLSLAISFGHSTWWTDEIQLTNRHNDLS